MKTNSIIIVLLFAFCISYGQKKDYSYFAESFTKDARYKVVLLPVKVDASDLIETENLKRKTYDELRSLLVSVPQFTIVAQSEIDEYLRVHSFGGLNDIDDAKYKEIAKSLEADLYVTTRIYTEAALGLYSDVQMFDVKSGNLMYQGRARNKKLNFYESIINKALGLSIKPLREKFQ